MINRSIPTAYVIAMAGEAMNIAKLLTDAVREQTFEPNGSDPIQPTPGMVVLGQKLLSDILDMHIGNIQSIIENDAGNGGKLY